MPPNNASPSKPVQLPVQKSASRYILTGLAIVVVFTALILAALNSMQTKQGSVEMPSFIQPSASSLQEKYVEGYKAAREKYAKMGPMIGQPSYSFNGVVKSVGSDSVVITQKSLDSVPEVDGVSDERTVMIGASTTIVLLTEKPKDEFEKELAAFQVKLSDPKNAKGPAVPPSMYNEESISLSALKPGEAVEVSASKDIRLEESFEAIRIAVSAPAPEVQVSAPPVPEAPPAE